MPAPLDEFPVHQAAVSMAAVATTDRSFYDRCYLNAHNRSDELFFISGLGVYPNLGVIDAYASVRIGETVHTVHYSDALGADRQQQRVGAYRIEVLEPLRRLRVVCDGDAHGIGFDLTWTGTFEAVQEQPHRIVIDDRPIVDTARFCQLGRWDGELRAGGRTFDVAAWSGMRDRSWGIRPVGESPPPGRPAEDPTAGFHWVYAPLQFDDFAVIVIAQENPDGYRTLNDAVRIWADGRVEQLGWPLVEIGYRPGTRHPLSARLRCTAQDGTPVVIEVETLTSVPLHVGCGYSGDPDWGHGRWYGRGFAEGRAYDLSDPGVAARIPWGVTDHVARATCDGAVGWGMFEHASMGRHDPSGFAGWEAVAP